MELVVRGRNVEVPEHFRTHVAEKFARVERYDAKIIRTDVELLHEKNPRQSDSCQRVEITCRVRGPVVRAEACAADFYAALDAAMDKIERRFRSSADRRRVHHGRHNPTSLAAATAGGIGTAVIDPPLTEDTDDQFDGPGRVVREKQHAATPMSLDQALFEMELVGHDFFLYHDEAADRPSVVYRRHAYDYGVIRLGD
jgi:ribosomal subunit interface protein